MTRVTPASSGPEAVGRRGRALRRAACADDRRAGELLLGLATAPAPPPAGFEAARAQHAPVAALDAGVVEHAALAQQAVQRGQPVVRDGHHQVVLEVEVHAVRRDQQALPPARDRGARAAARLGRVGRQRVLGDRADARDQRVGGEPGADPEQVEQRVTERGRARASSTRIRHGHADRGAPRDRVRARAPEGPREGRLGELPAGLAGEIAPDLAPQARARDRERRDQPEVRILARAGLRVVLEVVGAIRR